MKLSALFTLALNCLTTADGKSFDFIRCGAVIGCTALISLAGYHVATSNQFDPMAFGAGFGGILFGAGAGIGAKRKDEAPPVDEIAV